MRARGPADPPEEEDEEDGPLLGDGDDGQCASNEKQGVEGVTMTVGMGEFIVACLALGVGGRG